MAGEAGQKRVLIVAPTFVQMELRPPTKYIRKYIKFSKIKLALTG